MTDAVSSPVPAGAAGAGALVLFSGGQDSTTTLAWALDRYQRVETIGFDYGQRHQVELEQRRVVLDHLAQAFPAWAEKLGEDHMLDLSDLGRISETALTRDAEIAFDAEGLPSTFVPGRNLLFFTYAAAIAFRRGLSVLVGGMCETDYSGYPDCRDTTLKTLQAAITLGMGRDFVIETPLMWIDKAETWAMAERLGGAPLMEIIRKDTHTCYLGERGTLHDWGHGCGSCPACELRAQGWQSFQASRL
ncbi:7-cyano-7-deazaguanine synthase QueC [Pyruvatibacter mobilis]|uniref:7-cyano-7-deazaguanine synthase QueC n=1 Tax=Pyruvatibacter mobilis TaxID=1712261 RepID=UPI003BB1614C